MQSKPTLLFIPIVGRPCEGVLGHSVDLSRRKLHPRRQQLEWWQAVIVLLSASCTLNLDSLCSPCPLIIGCPISFLLFYLPKPFCLEMAYSHLPSPHPSFKPYPKFLKEFPNLTSASINLCPFLTAWGTYYLYCTFGTSMSWTVYLSCPIW